MLLEFFLLLLDYGTVLDVFRSPMYVCPSALPLACLSVHLYGVCISICITCLSVCGLWRLAQKRPSDVKTDGLLLSFLPLLSQARMNVAR